MSLDRLAAKPGEIVGDDWSYTTSSVEIAHEPEKVYLYVWHNDGEYKVNVGVMGKHTYAVGESYTEEQQAFAERDRILELLDSGARVIITGTTTAKVELLEERLDQS